MSSGNESDVLPRKCILRKTENFNGFGFNLHAEKGRAGQYIGKVDPGSPAEVAKLKQGDRIVEVDGVNIGNENHQQVVSRIKACGDVTELLVVDSETDKHYKDSKIVLSSQLTEVVTYDSGFMQSTIINEDEGQTNVEENGEVHQVEINGHLNSNGFHEVPNGHTVQATEEDNKREEETENVTVVGDYVNQEVVSTQNAYDSDAHNSDAHDSDAHEDQHDYINVQNDINVTHDHENVSEPEVEEDVMDQVEETTRHDTPEPEVCPPPVEATEDQIEFEPEPEPRRDEETGVEVDTEQHQLDSDTVASEVVPEPTADIHEDTSALVTNGPSDADFTNLSAKELRQMLLQKKKNDKRDDNVDFQHKLNMFNSMN